VSGINHSGIASFFAQRQTLRLREILSAALTWFKRKKHLEYQKQSSNAASAVSSSRVECCIESRVIPVCMHQTWRQMKTSTRINWHTQPHFYNWWSSLTNWSILNCVVFLESIQYEIYIETNQHIESFPKYIKIKTFNSNQFFSLTTTIDKFLKKF